jgi:hypothetical protein
MQNPKNVSPENDSGGEDGDEGGKAAGAKREFFMLAQESMTD